MYEGKNVRAERTSKAPAETSTTFLAIEMVRKTPMIRMTKAIKPPREPVFRKAQIMRGEAARQRALPKNEALEVNQSHIMGRPIRSQVANSLASAKVPCA